MSNVEPELVRTQQGSITFPPAGETAAAPQPEQALPTGGQEATVPQPEGELAPQPAAPQPEGEHGEETGSQGAPAPRPEITSSNSSDETVRPS